MRTDLNPKLDVLSAMLRRVTAEEEFIVGRPLVLECAATDGSFAAVFEDDEVSGYFYALDTSNEAKPIQDALHIYNVADVVDADKVCVAKIAWSRDNRKAVLLINDTPHAIFDFEFRQGYCRTGYAPPNSGAFWGSDGRAWQDSAIELFA